MKSSKSIARLAPQAKGPSASGDPFLVVQFVELHKELD